VANRDVDAVASLYAENAKFLPPGMPPCEGPEAIKAALQGLLDAGAQSLDLEPLEVREAGELTIEYGRYELGMDAGGESVTDAGKYIVVHEAQPDGSTKIVFDIFNSNNPPPGA
jgi:ketosteroid isomerase-like protein